jgi:FAD:protein FMN transferase
MLCAMPTEVRDIMGMPIGIELRDDGAVDVEPAFDWLRLVDATFSTYRSDSDICRLDRGEVTLAECRPEVDEVLTACLELERETQGYFSVRPAGRLDPSGYVKGWAVERAASLLSGAGSADHVVNGGGDVQCAGGRGPHGVGAREPWRVGIADPLRPGRLALVVGATDCAVATSGTAERGPHILDPHTGRPASGLASVTIAGPSLALADAYATAAFAMGPARARDWTASLDGYAAFAITGAGDTWHTPGFARYISPV